jgi:hypothetical protein
LDLAPPPRLLTKAGVKLTKYSADAFFKVLKRFPGGKAMGSVENFKSLAKQGKAYIASVGAKTLRQVDAATASGAALFRKTGKVDPTKARLATEFATDRSMRMGINEAVDIADKVVDSAKDVLSNSNARDLIKDGIKNGRFKSNQMDIPLDDGLKLIVRRDIGKSAHPFKKGGPDIDHYNFEIHVPSKKPGRFTPSGFNLHVDLNGNVLKN